MKADPSNLSKLLCRAGFTYKKTLMASERERADVRRERDEWRQHRQPAMQKSPGRLVFVDETSVKTNMTPLRGRSKRGNRGVENVVRVAPGPPWRLVNCIAMGSGLQHYDCSYLQLYRRRVGVAGARRIGTHGPTSAAFVFLVTEGKTKPRGIKVQTHE
ncbi:hypothetical protein [Rhizobium leguminosarum]|uniref:hypothetical protein n=1 Tax=Rhizobium leguminosarum TaxID=384 RepID=UPI001FE1BAC3|nr:hypothetical protein [Rhizobium leguminosarum]